MSDARFADTDTPLGAPSVETAAFEAEVVLFDEPTRMVHRLNSVAGAVWLICDGETSVAAMAIELGEVFGLEPSDLSEGIQQALGQLADEGLLVGFAAPKRTVLDPTDDEAADGSRLLMAPADP